MKDGAYGDDALTPEEEEQLKASVADGAPPTEEEAPVPGEAEPKPAETPAAAEPAAAAPAPASTGPQTEEEEFAAFLAANQGKTPEEIQRLAFQQSKRANKEAFQHRQSQQTLQQVQQRVQAAVQAAQKTKETAAEKRAALKQRLADDPDAVALELAEQRISDEELQADEAVQTARIDAAIALASQAIPDFHRAAPEIFSFGQEMGYSEEEVRGITDGRDLVTLYLAKIAGTLIKTGVIDTRGQFLQMPQPVAQTDPRLQPGPAAVQTLGSAPARTNGGGKTAEQQAIDLSNLSDEDFAKIPEEQLNNLLRQLN